MGAMMCTISPLTVVTDSHSCISSPVSHHQLSSQRVQTFPVINEFISVYQPLLWLMIPLPTIIVVYKVYYKVYQWLLSSYDPLITNF